MDSQTNTIHTQQTQIEQLLERSLDFIRSSFPQAFLQDLILSEMLINWYWNKSLYKLCHQKDSDQTSINQKKRENLIETPLLSSTAIKVIAFTRHIHLRTKPCRKLSTANVKSMVWRHHFYEKSRDQIKSIKNDFIKNGDNVIIDQKTGLMWQRRGSENQMTWSQAEFYIRDLNKQYFTGYSDWRLPTIEELASLLRPCGNKSGLYIPRIFSEQQTCCWSSDRQLKGWIWYASFAIGIIDVKQITAQNYVKAVRSIVTQSKE